MLVKTKAIIISALKYGEADLIVKAYTQSDGLKTYMLKGVLKSRKGKFRASMFQSLTRLELVANHRGAGHMEYLKEAKVTSHYENLYSDPVKMAMVMFLAELLKITIKEEEGNEALFTYLENSIDLLDASDKIANFHLVFLLQLSRFLGFMPEQDDRGMPVFNLLEGVFQEMITNDYCIQNENVALLKQFLGRQFDALEDIKLNQSARNDFLGMLLFYYELHVDGFHKPKSLNVLTEIFS